MSVPADLKAALADSYDLERVIGRGGMATVYQARDLKHGRKVAVKVLRPDLAASLGTDRFLKEIEIAANLSHPHIVPLYDSGEADSFLYYVMPLIEGESLRALLLRQGTLRTKRAVEITSRVADALEYAHGFGVLHRDIKPENILLSHGHPVVTDFGIAKAITTAAGEKHMTRTGLPIGTPGYMSPEQAAGLRELDARSDVFSLACVLYEMLVGDVPGMWLTDDAVRLGRFVDAVPEHRERLDKLSGRIEQALARALSMRPDTRLPTPGAFVAALNDRSDADRRYRESEVKDIVKRAAEDQAANPTRDPGLTIGAVEQIGAEVGLTPERVRSALQPRDTDGTLQKADKPNPFLGETTRLRIEHWLDFEVDEEDFPLMIEEVRTLIGNVGSTSKLGKAITWTTVNAAPGTGRDVQIMISPRNGRTRIVAQEQTSQLAGQLFGGIGGGVGGGGGGMAMGILMATTENPALALPAMVIVAVGALFGARRIFKSSMQRRRTELRELIERMAALARDG